MGTTTPSENTPQNILDTVLTLRGHRITLRRAIAEKLIRTYYNPATGNVDVVDVDRLIIDSDQCKTRRHE